MFQFNFPPTTFSRVNTVEQQIAHVESECREVLAAGTLEEKLKEMMDVVHSFEGLLRIIEEEAKANPALEGLLADRLKLSTIEKNDIRGYYAGFFDQKKAERSAA